MIKVIVNIGIAILGVIIAFQLEEPWNVMSIGFACTAGINILMEIGYFIGINSTNLKTVLNSYFLKTIRLSCSYLIIIKCDDKYLLVKNPYRESFQLVGGVFKRNSLSNSFLQKIEYTDDNKLPLNYMDKDDLRLFIRGKNLSKFIRWYNKDKQRELCYSREFFEELIETGILKHRDFPYPNVEFKKRLITPIIKSPQFNCHEILFFDLVELVISENQYKILKSLKEEGDTNYIKWASILQIRNEGYIEGKGTPYTIGNHTKWAIDQKYYK